MQTMLYNNLSGYLRKKYGKRLGKICIDGGFSCPNRDGKCSTGGCIFCGERGSGEHIDPDTSIAEQVKAALANAADDDMFIAYFQNFTNTYADVATLKNRYISALFDKRIRVLSVGTRPDCIDGEKAKLLAEIAKTHDVWVELGLQTSNDVTAELINRGYPRAVFEEAVALLKKYNIPTVVHIIIGLPGESTADAIATAEYVSSLKPFGIKIHSLYVMEGTRLADMYRRGEYAPISFEEYTSTAAHILSHLDPEIVVHRITGDCPAGLLVAPEWNRDKHKVIATIQDLLNKDEDKNGKL